MSLRPSNRMRVGRTRTTLMFLLSVCLAVVALGLPVGTASADVPPPTLTGETLVGGIFAPPGTSSLVVTSASCDPSSTSTFTYQASGPAAGPYPGTYSETGTVTIGPQTFAGTPATGEVTSWTASFTITSATGTVKGTKSLPPGTTGISGICKGADVLFLAQRSAATGAQNVLSYEAIITVPGGAQYADRGGSQASVNEFPDVPSFDNFFEAFASSQATTTPVCNQDSQTNQGQPGNGQGCANP